MIESRITRDVPLAPYTTLGVGGTADFFLAVEREDELQEAVAYAEREHLSLTILGGGSNVLIADAGIRGLVVLVAIGGIREDTLPDGSVLLTAGAGVMLDTVVARAVERELWGMENLSGIPGTIGATPIQNVGAYGVEIRDVLLHVRAYDRSTHTFVMLTRDECALGYRDSRFKREDAGRFVITEVTLKLSPNPTPKLAYTDLARTFGTERTPTLREIREAVLKIRSAKFPDWHTYGTAGSFFKNPSVTPETYAVLHAAYPDLPGYANADGTVKLALGWILDHVLTLRGARVGNVGLYEAQALVLVRYGEATAHDIFSFSESVRTAVREKTGVHIEREVMCLGTFDASDR